MTEEDSNQKWQQQKTSASRGSDEGLGEAEDSLDQVFCALIWKPFEVDAYHFVTNTYFDEVYCLCSEIIGWVDMSGDKSELPEINVEPLGDKVLDFLIDKEWEICKSYILPIGLF